MCLHAIVQKTVSALTARGTGTNNDGYVRYVRTVEEQPTGSVRDCPYTNYIYLRKQNTSTLEKTEQREVDL